MKITLLLLATGLAVAIGQECTCGIENTDSRIIGGKPVTEGKYPWMTFVSIETDEGTFQCGGAIINDRYILTASHCIDGATSASVGVGSNYDDSKNELIEVEEIIKHEEYDSETTHNDVALLKLKEPLKFSKKIQPICLPPDDMDQSGTLTVAGWGLTEQQETSNILLETSVNEYNWDDCNNDWGGNLIKSQFCAALVGKDSCGGDSGGPLIKRFRGKNYVVGIVSYGVEDCGSARSAVYTRVVSFLPWIKDHTEDAVYCSA